MKFRILGAPSNIETIASGKSVHVRQWLNDRYGEGRWRKMKGIANVEILATRTSCRVELPWYESHGIGKVEYKIKRFLD
jgi:hypothetical protein